MRILLTGATGTAGRSILRRLLPARRGPVFGTYRSDPPQGFLTEFEVPLATGQLKLLHQDLAELRPEQGPQVDAIIHCAARRPASRCALDPAAANRDNVLAVRRLVEWARVKGPSTFIHCSIHSVYATGKAPFRESDPTCATDLQVAAKLESESIITEELGRDIGHLILRLPHFYDPDLTPDGVLAAFTSAPPAGELRISGNGEQTVCFIELRDLADLMATLLEAPPPSGIYNAASKTISVGSLARMFQKVWHEQGRPAPALRFMGGPTPPSLGLVCDKLFAVCPWRPRHLLDEWVARAIAPRDPGDLQGD